MADNRNYQYSSGSVSRRQEYRFIAKLIKRGSRVIDLGSGDGSLLKELKEKKKIDGTGVEISPSGVESAKRKGVKSIVGRIDKELPFKDKEFDFAICNVTIQMVMYPEILMREMVRISHKQIVTFPNFAYIFNRLELLLMGRMPKFMIPGYEWYSTGHIHQFSISDFQDFCGKNDIKILDAAHIGPKKIFSLPGFILKKSPNLFANTGIFLTTGK